MVHMSREDHLDHLDHLGHLVPYGQLEPSRIERELSALLDRRLYSAGLGVPSVPTRFIVRMAPADRAWMPAGIEDEIGRRLTARTERAGSLFVGEIRVDFEVEPDAMAGRPAYWAGYTEGDLVVLVDLATAADVFARA